MEMRRVSQFPQEDCSRKSPDARNAEQIRCRGDLFEHAFDLLINTLQGPNRPLHFFQAHLDPISIPTANLSEPNALSGCLIERRCLPECPCLPARTLRDQLPQR